MFFEICGGRRVVEEDAEGAAMGRSRRGRSCVETDGQRNRIEEKSQWADLRFGSFFVTQTISHQSTPCRRTHC